MDFDPSALVRAKRPSRLPVVLSRKEVVALLREIEGVPRLHRHLAQVREQHATDIRTIQELLDHTDVATTKIYTHVLTHGPAGVLSPMDRLGVLDEDDEEDG